MVSLKTPFYFAEAIFLDLKSLPGKFMNLEGNARWHLNHVCPGCSDWRKKFRDPDFSSGRCLWEEQWEKQNYDFPRDFGFFNWLKYYVGMKTNLCKYAKSKPKL